MQYPESFDPRWHIRESSFEPLHTRYYESIFALGNGFLGTRGSLEEPFPQSSPATLIAGLFDRSPGEVTELANVANWVGIDIQIDGQRVSLADTKVLFHERVLDLQSGILYRKSTLQLGPTRQIEIVSRRFVSVADVHLMGVQYSLTINDPRPGKCALLAGSGFDGSVTNAGIQHFEIMDQGLLSDNSIFMHQRARHSDHHVALGGRVRLLNDGKPAPTVNRNHDKAGHVWLEMKADVEPGRQYTLEKIVTIYSSRESEDPRSAVSDKLDGCTSTSFERHVEDHRKAWADLWARSDVEIRGDDHAQCALRFSIFHLLQASSETDERVSIPAKGLTGLGYKGHIFWDTDIFMLPYLTLTNPRRSRNMLMYRYHTLEEARNKARQQGYRGALYAWESADSGEETTPPFVKHLTEDRQIQIWSGVSEHHVACDVAYAVWQYSIATGDTDFLRQYGAEIILETARFWSSRATFNRERDRYDILTVIGPDEYHENVDNNFFTNAMAQWNIRKGIELYNHLKSHHPSDWKRLTGRLSLTEKEIAEWRTVAEKMFIHEDPATGVFVQFDGFMELDDIDLATYANRTQPMDVVLGPEAVQKSKIVKQPDVLMIFSLLRDEYTDDVKRRNWEFYEPICGHGSSLSPAIHSLIASDIGLPARAYEYFERAAGIDLNDRMGNAEHGIHAATAGGLLQAALFGFAGVRITENGLVVNPRLPERWESMRFTLVYKGTPVSIVITH